MAFDGLFTHWMTKELSSEIVGGRISKIHQPLANEIQFTIRSQRKNYILLFSAHPMMARVQFMQEKAENPEFAPNFCMLLRKYLEGAIVQSMRQIGSDRIIELDIDTRDELGDFARWRFIIEIMGKHSNMFLIDRDTMKIIDCLKRIPLSQNTFRTLQPGATYQAPPHQEKKNPFDYSLVELDTILHLQHTEYPMKKLMNTFQGISHETAVEILERAEKRQQSLAEALYDYLQQGNEHLEPTMTIYQDKAYFTPFPYLSLPGKQSTYPSLSLLIEQVYIHKVQADRIQQLAGNLLIFLKNELKKNRDKMIKLEDDLKKSEDAEMYRIKGELLNAYQYSIQKGQESITVEDFYEQKPVTIELYNWLTPSQNAQSYFKRYQKLKKSIHFIEEQKEKTLQEIDYIENILLQIEDSDIKNLEIIREELMQTGYLKRQAKKGKQKKPVSKPYVFYSSNGTRILVGRNNQQNDQLTLKDAKKNYLWLHAQNIPGAHVIIESEHPTDETIGEAAMLAAYYSKFRFSATVPVDYLPVSKIRKPNGAKPGFVVYEGQQNTYITPDFDVIERLKKNTPPQ